MEKLREDYKAGERFYAQDMNTITHVVNELEKRVEIVNQLPKEGQYGVIYAVPKETLHFYNGLLDAEDTIMPDGHLGSDDTAITFSIGDIIKLTEDAEVTSGSVFATVVDEEKLKLINDETIEGIEEYSNLIAGHSYKITNIYIIKDIPLEAQMEGCTISLFTFEDVTEETNRFDHEINYMPSLYVFVAEPIDATANVPVIYNEDYFIPLGGMPIGSLKEMSIGTVFKATHDNLIDYDEEEGLTGLTGILISEVDNSIFTIDGDVLTGITSFIEWEEGHYYRIKDSLKFSELEGAYLFEEVTNPSTVDYEMEIIPCMYAFTKTHDKIMDYYNEYFWTDGHYEIIGGGSGSGSSEYHAGVNISIDENNVINVIGYTYDQSNYSFSEGNTNSASGNYSHSEGFNTQANGYAAHAEGISTIASGDYSHAEGSGTVASGSFSHAEGNETKANGGGSHAEGSNTIASGDFSHAEGNDTVASGGYSHAEGSNTTAIGNFSHSEGHNTIASGTCSHAEGSGTTASGTCSHAEGSGTTAGGTYSHAEGIYSTAHGNNSHVEGESCHGYGSCSHAEGWHTRANDNYSHAEGYSSYAGGNSSHAEGSNTIASGDSSHAEGYGSNAEGNYSHTEGFNTQANGGGSHAEGDFTIASGDYSHAEGCVTSANDFASHAEGYNTKALGNSSHAEGYYTIASGVSAHAEGYNTTASTDYSHAEGRYTQTSNQYEHAEGAYNVTHKGSTIYGSSGNTQHSIGIGTATSSSYDRKNAFEIMQNGDAYLYGIGGYVGTNTKAQDNTIQTLQEYIASLEQRIATLENNNR